MSRNLLESLIIVLIALTFGIVLTVPKYQDLQDLKVVEAQKSADLKNKEEYFNQLAEISSELKNYEGNLQKIKTALPVDTGIASLANFLQSSSSQSGLILKNLTYGSGVSASAAAGQSGEVSYILKTYDISMSLSGSYGAFKDFLSKIEKSSRVIEMQEISFVLTEAEKDDAKKKIAAEGTSPDAAATPEMTYEFTVKMKAHYY
jgi:Tfp pilus assembly protein PilO